MDMRIERTRRNIINAFLQLRSRKPLEKITVKELSSLAEINKATFYLHFHDIYDLSETLERECVQTALSSIEHPESIFKNNKLFTKELAEAIFSNERLIVILFEGSRSSSFMDLFEKGLKELISKVHPEYQESLEKNIAITYLTYGGYYEFMKYHDQGSEEIIKLIGKLSEEIVKLYEDEQEE